MEEEEEEEEEEEKEGRNVRASLRTQVVKVHRLDAVVGTCRLSSRKLDFLRKMCFKLWTLARQRTFTGEE